MPHVLSMPLRTFCVRMFAILVVVHRFDFSDFCVQSNRWARTRASKLVHACALLLCDIQRGCERALLSMWVHACFFSAICNEHCVLISFGDICLSDYPCSCGYTLIIPPPIPFHTTLGPNIPHVLFPSSRPLGGGLPSSERDDKTYDRRRKALTLFVFVLITKHGLPRSHTWPRTLTTPLHDSHLLPAHTPAPCSHFYFGYKNACPRAHLGLSQPSLRTARPPTNPHALAKYTKEPWLYPPLPLTKEPSFVGRA